MADKKISELTAITGAATAADDVLPIVDTSATETKKITRAELAIALGVPSGGTAWGSITGTLSSQTDLQSALDAKQATLPTLTNGQVWQFQSGSLAATTNLKDTSNANSIEVNARILRGTNGTSSKLNWSGSVPVAPEGLIVGVDTLGPEVLKVASDSGQILADFCQAQDDTTAMLTYSTYSGGTKNSVLEQSFLGPGNSGGRGAFNSLLGEEYDWALGWDGSDFGTRFRNYRLGFFGKQTYVTPFSVDGVIQQAINGAAGLNNYYRTGILDSSVTNDQYYDRITDEFGGEFQNIIYLKGTGNTVPGPYSVPFQGWLNQQKKLTDDTDTGWGFQFANEAFSRFQINGDATYQMQVRNSAGDLIGGFRGLRPVVNSANVTPRTLTPTGNYIEYVDETGEYHFVPTYA